jgi:alkanesulfonate monooxygenase SsuD/methylene tetrahydromethanopterin reductase-like flavin-dependent oxidoreductase (luciferase family)
VKDYRSKIGPAENALLEQVLSSSAVGSAETVARETVAFIERTGADELMITSNMFDHAARLRSYEITAAVRKTL